MNYAIFDELCEKLPFEVNYAKSQHCRISEALNIGFLRLLSTIMLRTKILQNSAREHESH